MRILKSVTILQTIVNYGLWARESCERRGQWEDSVQGASKSWDSGFNLNTYNTILLTSISWSENAHLTEYIFKTWQLKSNSPFSISHDSPLLRVSPRVTGMAASSGSAPSLGPSWSSPAWPARSGNRWGSENQRTVLWYWLDNQRPLLWYNGHGHS